MRWNICVIICCACERCFEDEKSPGSGQSLQKVQIRPRKSCHPVKIKTSSSIKKEEPLGLPDQWCWLWVTVTDSIWSNLPKGCFLRHTKRRKNISEACFKVQIVQLRKNYFLRSEEIQSSYLGSTRALDNLATQPRKHWRKIQQIDSKFKFLKPPWTGKSYF